MNLANQPNLLLEALAYLGRIANGNSWEHIEERIISKKFEPTPAFTLSFSRLKELSYAPLMLSDAKEKEALTELFGNIEGFPHNTIGSASVAFLLFYPLLERYQGNLNDLIEYLQTLPSDQIAYHIAATLELTDFSVPDSEFGEYQLIDILFSLSIPDKSKLAILNICHNYTALARRAAKLLLPVISYLEAQLNSMQALSDDFSALVASEGARHYLEETSHLELSDHVQYTIRPFIFGMDTTLTFECDADHIVIYSGILRKELLFMLSEHGNSYDDVFNAYHILGDRTRFDILCHLRRNSAYGQELSEHFSLSRNTIHHHMNKLISTGLVSCSIEGNRTYYSLNKTAFFALLQRQEELFG